MAADKPQPNLRLLEHLYPDEVDAGDAVPGEEASKGGASEPRDSAELAEFEAMLARIRREDLGEAVPPSLHASVIDAAREHAQARVSRAAQVTRRAPHAPDPAAGDSNGAARATRPLWARVKFGIGGQIAMVATVMLVAGVIFVKTQVKAPQTKFLAANSEVAEHVQFDGNERAVSKNQALSGSAAPAEPVAQNTALPAIDGEAAPMPSTLDPVEEADKPAELDRAQAQYAAPTTPSAKAPSGRARPDADTSASGLLARVDEGAAKKDSKQANFAPLGARRRASRKRSLSSKSMKAKAPAKSLAKKTEAKPVPDSLRDDSLASSAEIAAAVDELKEAEAVAPSGKEAPAAAQLDKKAPSLLDSIAESFASAHYDEVLVRADAFAKSGAGTSREKAQALEYKARAQSAMGKSGAALDTYEKLQSAHPDYKKDHISAQIARLRRQQAPMRREAAPRKMQLDSATPAPAAEPQLNPTY